MRCTGCQRKSIRKRSDSRYIILFFFGHGYHVFFFLNNKSLICCWAHIFLVFLYLGAQHQRFNSCLIGLLTACLHLLSAVNQSNYRSSRCYLLCFLCSARPISSWHRICSSFITVPNLWADSCYRNSIVFSFVGPISLG